MSPTALTNQVGRGRTVLHHMTVLRAARLAPLAVVLAIGGSAVVVWVTWFTVRLCQRFCTVLFHLHTDGTLVADHAARQVVGLWKKNTHNRCLPKEERNKNNSCSNDPHASDLKFSPLQPSWTFQLLHATLQQNDCTSSNFPMTRWPLLKIKVVHLESHCRVWCCVIPTLKQISSQVPQRRPMSTVYSTMIHTQNYLAWKWIMQKMIFDLSHNCDLKWKSRSSKWLKKKKKRSWLVYIILPSLKEIGLQMSEHKPMLTVFFFTKSY